MKRFLALLLAICTLFCGSLFLVSCNSDEDKDDDKTNGEENNGEENNGSENNGSENNGGENNGGGQSNPEKAPFLTREQWLATPTALTYEQYQVMTTEEKKSHYDCFSVKTEYFGWYNAAKAKYEEDQNREEIGDNDSSVDLG